MIWKNAIALSLAVLPLIEAHPNGVPGAPQLFGRSTIENQRRRAGTQGVPQQKRSAKAAPAAAPAAFPELGQLHARQGGNVDNQCGPGIASCADGYCCSPAGWCGLGEEYCAGPDCQLDYGTGCDAFQVPPGPVTSNVARPKLGSVPYGGVGIYDCVVRSLIT
jgi:hypothetical protein